MNGGRRCPRRIRTRIAPAESIRRLTSPSTGKSYRAKSACAAVPLSPQKPAATTAAKSASRSSRIPVPTRS